MTSFYKIKNHIRNIKYGLANIITYIPIIWKDRDWDHYFLLVLMEKKLERMEKLQRNYGNGLYSERYARQLQICKVLCNRLSKDDYCRSEYDKHSSKWGDLEFSSNKIRFISRKNVITEEDRKKESREVLSIYNKSNYIRNEDKNLLFKTMKRHLLNWWD